MTTSPVQAVDGVLLVDKPSGPTSHDVVQRVRRALRTRAVGHTGTLDPMASGLLPMVVGRATRLATLLTGHDKTYLATIHLGVATETDDALGATLGVPALELPDDGEVRAVVEGFSGTFLQTPPRYSAKKIGGTKAYELARRQEPTHQPPCTVTLSSVRWVGREGPQVHLEVRVSAGFYVRSLARDVGQRLGCGAHLSALRRTTSGRFDVSQAVTLDDCERLGALAAERMISPADAVADLDLARLTEAGLTRALHGNFLDHRHFQAVEPAASFGRPGRAVRILAPDGRLVALGEWRGQVLHPAVVLG